MIHIVKKLIVFIQYVGVPATFAVCLATVFFDNEATERCEQACGLYKSKSEWSSWYRPDDQRCYCMDHKLEAFVQKRVE